MWEQFNLVWEPREMTLNLSLKNEPKMSQIMRGIENSEWRKQYMQRPWGRQEDADVKSTNEEHGMSGEQRIRDHNIIHVFKISLEFLCRE